jgi:peroxiredoxin
LSLTALAVTEKAGLDPDRIRRRLREGTIYNSWLRVKRLVRAGVRRQMSLVPVGELAPEFELPAVVGGVKRKFRLGSQRGKRNVLLAFYPANWSEVTCAQLTEFQAETEQLRARQTLAVSVCVDSIMNTTAWEREIGPLDFPMCADFWPHGRVCRLFGALREQDPMHGAADRITYLIDRAGKVAFRQAYGLQELPGLRTVLDVLASLV